MEGKQVKDWSQSGPPRQGRGRPKGNPKPFTAAERRTRNAELERGRRGSLASTYSEARQAVGLHDTATRRETLIAAAEYIKRLARRDSVDTLRRQNAELQRQIALLKRANKKRRELSSKTASTFRLEPSSNHTDYDNVPSFVLFKTEQIKEDTEPYTSYPENTPFLNSFTTTPNNALLIFAGIPRNDQNPMLSSVNVTVPVRARPDIVVALPEGYLTPTEEHLPLLFPELE